MVYLGIRIFLCTRLGLRLPSGRLAVWFGRSRVVRSGGAEMVAIEIRRDGITLLILQ